MRAVSAPGLNGAAATPPCSMVSAAAASPKRTASLSERPSDIAAMVPAAKESPAPLTAVTAALRGRYERVSPAEGEMPYSAQGALLARLCG